MIARLIGIIGSTHGVRFSASPPIRINARMASGPRPSNQPCSASPDSARWMNSRNCSSFRYPPVVAATVNRSSRASTSPSSRGAAGAGGGADPGGSPASTAVKAMPSNSSARAVARACPPGATRTWNASRAVAGM